MTIEKIKQKLERLKAIQENRIAKHDTNATLHEIHALTYSEAMFLINMVEDIHIHCQANGCHLNDK